MKNVTKIGFGREKKVILFGCKLGRVLERPRAKFAGKKKRGFLDATRAGARKGRVPGSN